MVGGSGADTLLAGAGADTMAGGAGSNIFAFFQGATSGHHDFITDFNANDSVYIIGYDSTQSASSLEKNATVGPGGVTLTLSDSTQITFSNLSSTNPLDGHILYGPKTV
jgi:Ca2+-binding RTX toxin-like protein